MDLGGGILFVLLLTGLILVGYGLATGDRSSYALHVTGPVGDGEIRNSTPVVAYEDLPDRFKTSFRESLDSGELISIADPPAEETQIVEYRGEQYRMAEVSIDASQTRMVAFMVSGGALVVLSLVGKHVTDG